MPVFSLTSLFFHFYLFVPDHPLFCFKVVKDMIVGKSAPFYYAN